MLTGSTVLKRAMALGALALSTSSLAVATAHAAVPDVGRSCATENWVWSGAATVDLTMPAFDTTVVVPVVVGTELVVVGVSADGLTDTGHARPLAVTVGGVPALPGAIVPGGPVVVVGDGSPASLNGVTVTIDRCAQVQSAAPEPVVPAGPADGALPRTGVGTEWGASTIGMVAVGIGSAMIVAGRRRASH